MGRVNTEWFYLHDELVLRLIELEGSVFSRGLWEEGWELLYASVHPQWKILMVCNFYFNELVSKANINRFRRKMLFCLQAII